MNVFELFAKIALDKSEYDDSLGDAEKEMQGFGAKLKQGLGSAAKAGGAALAVVGAAGAALTKTVINGASEVAQHGDNIDKMSQKLGISAQAYQEWDAILQHSGASIDGMQRGMMSLASAAEKDSDAFRKLGISEKQVASMSQEELFSAVITGLQGMEEGSERAVLAQQLLGGAAKELGPLLNTSAEETEKMRRRVHELGGVMSDEAVKAAAAYQDSLQDMQTAFSGLSRGLMSEFMPSITTVMDGLTEIFSGDSDKGIQMISDGVDNLVTTISDKLPMFLDLGMGILDSLVDAIISNLPKLLGTAGALIGKLISGIMSYLPELIRQAPEIIKAIIKGLVSAWPEIKAAGFDLIDMLGQGIEDAFWWLVDLGSQVIDKIAEGISNAWSGLVNWFNGLWNGLFGGRSVNVDVNGRDNINGSHAGGLDYVPFNGYLAKLHEGEAVLTKGEANAWRRGSAGSENERPIVITSQLVLDGKVIGESVKRYERKTARAMG